MGKKRQRIAANGAEDQKPAPQKLSTPEPASEPTKKKHKKVPLQLKVIGVTAVAPVLKKESQGAASSTPSSKINATTEDESSKKKKKKKKNKNKNKPNGGDNDHEHSSAQPTKANTEDIDDLFKSLKTKKKENAEAAEREKVEAAQAKKKQRKEREQLEEQIKLLEAQNTNFTAVQGKNPDPRPVRYDADGLPIYSEDSLQINKGGDTADCPFDCWCCF